MSIKGQTTGIFVYGYNLNPDGSLGIGTKRRLLGALQIHMQTPHSVIVAAAGISPDVPAQMVPMHTLIAEFLARYPFISVHEVPAGTFDTTGERTAFLSIGFVREIHVTSWWHIPRVWIGRRSVPTLPRVRSVTYRAVWDRPTLRSAGFEIGKLFVTLFLPRSWQKQVARLIKSRVRTSW